jgi:hypothetical protein
MDSDILLFNHSFRDCVYDEGKACIDNNKDNASNIRGQLIHYKTLEYPAHNGLYNTACMVRKHTPELKGLSTLWWEEIDRFSHRDQISLPYVLWKTGIPFSVIPDDKRVDTFIQERILTVGG